MKAESLPLCCHEYHCCIHTHCAMLREIETMQVQILGMRPRINHSIIINGQPLLFPFCSPSPHFSYLSFWLLPFLPFLFPNPPLSFFLSEYSAYAATGEKSSLHSCTSCSSHTLPKHTLPSFPQLQLRSRGGGYNLSPSVVTHETSSHWSNAIKRGTSLAYQTIFTENLI